MNDNKPNLEQICTQRDDLIALASKVRSLHEKLGEKCEAVNCWNPIRFDWSHRHSSDSEEIDSHFFHYMMERMQLQKYMLTKDFEKAKEDISKRNFPEFTLKNVTSWLSSLQTKIHTDVIDMCTSVYEAILEGRYYTGNITKKRNNNGVDQYFILATNDHDNIFKYSGYTTNLMDDLEKVCYILDGKVLPDNTLRKIIRDSKTLTASNPYFSVQLYKNGNTHFRLTQATQSKLNRLCANRTLLGDNVRIKILFSY